MNVSYVLQSSNGSAYLLTISGNPKTDAVFATQIRPFALSSLYSDASSVSSETYSGYAVAGNSSHSEQLGYTASQWYVAAAHDTSTVTCGLSTSTCISEQWVGLQNSTYDGPDHLNSTGEVIQTGTQTIYAGCPSACYAAYDSFAEYLSGKANGVTYNTTDVVDCDGGPGHFTYVGDSVTGIVGSEQQINGTSGTQYSTILHDWTQSWMCSFHVNFSDASKTYGKEYYSDYFVERPQCGLTCFYHLANFSAMTFYDCESGTTGSTTFYNYPEYNNGYGFASYMGNGAYQNTDPMAWVLNSGSTTVAHFETDYYNSYGT